MKVIDLLNKIAKGEDIPNKIKFDGDIFVYNQAFKDYEYPDKAGWLMDISRDSGNIFFNDEVEIIEEEKIEIYDYCDNYEVMSKTVIANNFLHLNEDLKTLIDEINKLKNRDK